jgi:hypothetical protein
MYREARADPYCGWFVPSRPAWPWRNVTGNVIGSNPITLNGTATITMTNPVDTLDKLWLLIDEGTQ